MLHKPLIAGGLVTIFGVAQLVSLPTPAAALSDTVYDFAQLRSNQFVETWTSVQGGAVHIRVHVANQRGGFFAQPFPGIETLSFQDARGIESGELKFNFNVPASQKNGWYDITVPTAFGLFEGAAKIVASVAQNNAALPPPGSWTATLQVGGSLPVVIRPS